MDLVHIHKNPTKLIIAKGLSVTQTRASIGLRERVKERKMSFTFNFITSGATFTTFVQ